MEKLTREGKPFTIEYKTNSEHTSVRHFHDAYELVYFTKADLTLFVKDNRLRLQDGDLLLVNAFELHKYLYNPDASYVRYVINFKPEFISALITALHMPSLLDPVKQPGFLLARGNVKTRQEAEGYFRRLFESHAALSEEAEEAELAPLKLELSSLLLYFFRLARSPKPEPTAQEAQIRRVIQYIDAHYEEDITLERLQKALFMNKYRIAHLFKEITGFTVVEYIQHRRVIEAQKLLLNSFENVTEIGIRCGFNSVQHFCRVFRKFAAMTPAQYRKHRKNDVCD